MDSPGIEPESHECHSRILTVELRAPNNLNKKIYKVIIPQQTMKTEATTSQKALLAFFISMALFLTLIAVLATDQKALNYSPSTNVKAFDWACSGQDACLACCRTYADSCKDQCAPNDQECVFKCEDAQERCEKKSC